MMKCITIGYQGRNVDRMAEELAAVGAEVLLDVRAAAWSQRPEFRKTALAAALAKKGIRYVHESRAGNPFRPKGGAKLDWDVCARAYRAHLNANPSVIDRVLEVLQVSMTALLCYERAPSDCHRGVLIEELNRRHGPIEVQHLM
jgi:uncharacterized protein (DUF488 family)